MRELWAVRCTATSKRSGLPCRAWAVIGAFVCVKHGGRAKQVREAAARRWEIELAYRDIERRYEIEHGEPMPPLAVAYLRYRFGDMATWRRHRRTSDATA